MSRRALSDFSLWPWVLGLAVCTSVAGAQTVDWPSERPAAAPGRAQGDVPAVRDAHARQRPAGHCGPSP